MAGRNVVVKNGVVIRIDSGGLSINRDGAFFRFRIRPKKGSPHSVRSMYLEDLLSRLNNRDLADSIGKAFALEGVSPRDIDEVLPGFFLNRK